MSNNANNQGAREQLVAEHIRLENAHDLTGLMATFGDGAAYDDEPWGDHRRGLAGVQDYYKSLLTAVPDLRIDVVGQHVAEDTIIVEVIISGTHLGDWRGVPATGRKIRFPLCGIYTFDENDRIAGERIYYDRMEVLKQIGLMHDPLTTYGRLMTGLTHPLTLTKAIGRKVFRSNPQ
jgi:steroid delta-isomerase-like uncharacterized protein